MGDTLGHALAPGAGVTGFEAVLENEIGVGVLVDREALVARSGPQLGAGTPMPSLSLWSRLLLCWPRV